MVKPTQYRSSNDIPNGHHIVVGGTDGDALAISLMRPALVEVANVLPKDSAIMIFAQE